MEITLSDLVIIASQGDNRGTRKVARYLRLKESQPIAISNGFITNITQSVRLPTEVGLPEEVKQVTVRAIGNERIVAPVNNGWDSFFMDGPQAGKDFMAERASQQQREREALE